VGGYFAVVETRRTINLADFYSPVQYVRINALSFWTRPPWARSNGIQNRYRSRKSPRLGQPSTCH